MSEIKVNSIKGVGASAAAITVNNSDGTCTANITNKPNRNLIINGAMQVAQRGTSHTGGGYGTVDRWQINASNLSTGSAIPKSQQSLSSSDTPYTLGFRKFARLALPAAGSASANSYAEFQQKIEAQNISNSGWNYNSTSSFITLQFWFRCSTNQTFYGWVTSTDGTNKRYTFSFTASGDNTWTKVTKTIPGASGIQIDNDSGEGFNVFIAPFYGTDYTGSVSLDTWVTKNDATHSPDYASTWLTAGASTFDLTGVQLEVSSVATDFEHRSFGQELALCQRYFYMHANGEFPLSNTSHCPIGMGYGYTSTAGYVMITFPTQMRTNPSLYKVVGTDYFNFAYNNNNGFPNDISANRMSSQVCELSFHTGSSWDQNASGMFRTNNTAARVGFSAEL